MIQDDGAAWQRWREQAGGNLVVSFGDVEHFIGKVGGFRVRAMLCSPPPPKAVVQRYGSTEAIWTGRVVSEPVEVLVRPADITPVAQEAR